MRLRSLYKWIPCKCVQTERPRVAVIPLAGVIGRLGPFRRGLTASSLEPVLTRAFKLKDAKAVALVINSPGGSAVQSALIAKRIRALATKHKLPVIAFAEDVAASGGYWLACAADEIFANDASIVGSIGVISASFGFPETLKRWGIERRVYTAGEHKGALDPFRPEQAEDVEHLKALQGEVHEAFRTYVRSRRAEHLNASDEELFNGRFWSGKRAFELGLIDGIGDLHTVMRERFGDKVRLVTISDGRSWWRRRFAMTSITHREASITALPESLIGALEERQLYARFGL